MDQIWKGLSHLDPRDPGGFYKKPLLRRDREWRTTDVTNAFRYKSVIKTNTKIFDRILKYDVKMQNPNRITIDLSSPQSCHYLA